MAKFLKRILIIFLLIIICLTSLIIYNNNHLIVRNETIQSEKFSFKEDDCTIVYFSDLHYSKYIKERFLKKVVEKINNENPDLVIFGGDLIDKLQEDGVSEKQKETLISYLKSIKSNNGKYAILGNHDYSSGSYEIAKDIYSKSGFTLLKDDCVEVKLNDNNKINLLGIDSLFFSWDLFLSTYYNVDLNNYTFAIIHHPDLIDYLFDIHFDYVLSGHSHGGQIFIPMFEDKYNIYGCTKYFRGINIVDRLNDSFVIDVSNGVGRTRINARFNANAEIVKYQLKGK